jgi:hypothetical protein
MSENPCTGIDKAILKFGLQDCKISQNVSVKISGFFPNFARQLLPDFHLKWPFLAFVVATSSQSVCFLTKLTARLSPPFFAIPWSKKICPPFFHVIFPFLKIIRTFFLHEAANFIRRFI